MDGSQRTRSTDGPALIVLHRRRRAVAVLLLALFALLVGMLAGASARRHHRDGRTARAVLLHPRRVARVSLPAREALAIERTRARIPIVRLAGSRRREIALTFDDGPGPYTPAIIRTLSATHTPATFFEVGEELRYFGASTSEIARLGDVLGDHTWSHPNMAGLPARAQRQQLLREAAAIGGDGAAFPQLYRPPFGRWDETTLRLLAQTHMLMVLWSVDTDDWQRPGAAAIVHNALAGARPGAIILMHDGGGDRSQTVQALPRIIAALHARGYRLVTVPRLILDDPPPRDQDVGSVRGQGG